jgi:endonuclease/exonuclease/phosphatase family metal-dependent hydrolase
LRNKDKGYHIDYCFVPKQSTIERVAIGNYDEWKDLSDHRPLIVDLALNASC